MAKVTIHLFPPSMMGLMFFDKKVLPVIRDHLPHYQNAGSFETQKEGESAAEEAFDLTNNPYRQSEREQKYGRGRSVSTGDVIEVDDQKFACMSIGWVKL